MAAGSAAAASWDGLAAELDRWAEAGRTAGFWWRDDDGGAARPELARLLALTAARGIAPLLAVVPDWAEDALAELLSGSAAAAAQHGVAHRNRAPGGSKKTELVDGAGDLDTALKAGFARLERLLPGRLLPVLVPPWNRIGPALRARLPGLGYRGLSLFRPRPAPLLHGLALTNCHVDPVDWHRGRGFVGEAAALSGLAGHLAARREGKADAGEPTGILSHHAVHDAATWHFLEALADFVTSHPAAAWQDPRRLFGGGR